MTDRSETSALERLVAEHLEAAIRFAVKLTGSVEAAEDVVQEALVRVCRRWRTFRGEASFRTWFFRIVINAFRDARRRSRPARVFRPEEGSETEQAVPLSEIRDERAESPAEAAMTDELESLVAATVSKLPPRQREVIVLSVYEGFTTREIAAILDMGAATVRANLHVARSELRRRLAPYFANR